MAKMVAKWLNSIPNSWPKRLKNHTLWAANLKATTTSLDVAKRDLQKRTEEIDFLNESLDNLEQNTRKYSLEFYGIPENSYASTEEAVLKIAAAFFFSFVMLCIICFLQSASFTICYNQKFSLSFSLPTITALSAITTIEKILCYLYSNLFPSKVIRLVMVTIYFWPKFAWAKFCLIILCRVSKNCFL